MDENDDTKVNDGLFGSILLATEMTNTTFMEVYFVEKGKIQISNVHLPLVRMRNNGNEAHTEKKTFILYNGARHRERAYTLNFNLDLTIFFSTNS